jgi:sporulation protein YlmC with PRC-barrel domain
MKRKALFELLMALAIAFGLAAPAGAQTATEPIVGGSIVAVNVDVVAATGYRASKLLGSAIYNDEGEKIGKLDDFIVGSDSEVSIAVVAVGGFLNMGARMVAVPATLFESNDQGQMVLPGATKDVLKALPEFRYAK